MYRLIDEASEETRVYSEDLQELIDDANSISGKQLILDDNDNVVYDSNPNISYKI